MVRDRSLLLIGRRGHRSLVYGALSVTDASGRHVPAWIATAGPLIVVRVNDVAARYPLRIDPLVYEAGAELTASDGVGGDDFGFSVAISGDTVVVGAGAHQIGPNRLQGAAYVFTQPSNGGWQDATQTAELTASDGTANDEFGTSVAISGETIVVGAAYHEVGMNAGQGAAYVFTEPSTGGWQNATQTAELTASDGAANDEFGTSVAISGDTVVVGAPSHKVGTNYRQGAAYVFTEPSTGGWQNATQTAELTASDGAAQDQFGSSVAVAGDTVVVGAEGHVGLNSDQGAAYVFTEPSTGGWQDATQTAELTPSDGGTGNGFGRSVAVSGETVVVGGSAAYVFTEPSTGGWQNATQTAELTASDGGPGEGFGNSVAVSGDTVVVGATNHNVGVNENQGAAYVFTEPSTGGWQNATQTAELTANDGTAGDGFGNSVAIDADTSVVGANQQTAAGVSEKGAAYVFPPVPAVLTPPSISGTDVQGQTLTEVNGSWSGYPDSRAYQWDDCDNSGGNCSPIASATSQTYTLQNSDAGHTIVVRETALNVGGTSAPSSSAATEVVTPLIPAAGSAPTISGTPVEGETLTESHGSWTNNPTSYSYQWEDCDGSGTACVPITGATGQSYTLATGDIGSRIVVSETAANAGGSSDPANSAATETVAPSGPVGAILDDGDYATNDPKVTIEPVWPLGTKSILVSNNDGFQTDVGSFAPAASIPWTLEQTGDDRLPKTVYLRFLGVGMDDINFTPNIILDETVPTIQSATLTGGSASDIASASRASAAHTFKLRLAASDKLVGLCADATGTSRSAKRATVTHLASCKRRGILKLKRTLRVRARVAPKYVRVQNSAGSWSRWLTIKALNIR